MKRLSEEGFNVTEQEVRIKDLNKADEIWVTSSTKEIQPVHQVDNMVLPGKDLEEYYWDDELYQKDKTKGWVFTEISAFPQRHFDV